MPPEIVRAACERAHEAGLKVAAHVESPIGVKVALENGVDSIEHGAKPDEEIIKLFKETGATLCTTLSPALPYRRPFLPLPKSNASTATWCLTA